MYRWPVSLSNVGMENLDSRYQLNMQSLKAPMEIQHIGPVQGTCAWKFVKDSVLMDAEDDLAEFSLVASLDKGKH